MTCVTCARPLPPKARRFCSKQCNDRWRSVIRNVPFTCTNCGQTVLIARKRVGLQRYCTRGCARATYNRIHFVGPGNPNWRGGKVLSYGPGWNETKQLIRERDKVCQGCGKTPKENGRALQAKARAMRKLEKSLRQVGRALGVSHQTVDNWLKVP